MRFSPRGCRLCLFPLSLLVLSCAAQDLYVQTSDPRIQYSPGWSLTEGNASHITNTAGATATFSFEGTYVALRSTRSSTQGIERILVDGVEHIVNCSWPDASVAGETVVVFEQDNLAPTSHSVTFIKDSPPELVAVVWDFMYRPLSAAASPPTSTSGTALQSEPASMGSTSNSAAIPIASPNSYGSGHDSKSGVSAATIGAAAGSSVLFLVFLALLLAIMIRRRRRRSRIADVNWASEHSEDGNEAGQSKDVSQMAQNRAEPVSFAIQPAHQDFAGSAISLHTAKSIDDAASMIDEDALSPAQRYAEQTRSQSLATDDTASLAPSWRARSGRDKPPTYITSRTRAKRNILDSKLADMSNNDIPGGVLLETPSSSVRRGFSDRKRSALQVEKMGHLAEEDVPGGVLLEDASSDLTQRLAGKN